MKREHKIKKLINKKIIAAFICAAMVVSPYSSSVLYAENETGGICEEPAVSNRESQNYLYDAYGHVINSYLCNTSDGNLMRLQYISDGNYISVSYYDDNYELKGTKEVSVELPLFGGFYESEDAYFVVSGMKNEEESDDAEVYRITKYDKQWNRISSCSLYGANTYIPFEAGSLRMTDDGKYLFIRTCHTMYASDDNLPHQANVTIEVDMENMQITDSFTGVANLNWGYVSHSFNQFIKVENGNIVAVDHGDAYPRAICLIKYNTAASEGKFLPEWPDVCETYNIVEFEGKIGANYTGAEIGGFEISDSSYLVAYANTYDFNNEGNKNIFIGVVSKETGEIQNHQLTSYSSSDDSVVTAPQFVSLNNGKYLVLWTVNNVIYYAQIDKDGNQVGETMHMEGNLSDCVPIIRDNKLVWYVTTKGSITFYEISCDNPENNNCVKNVSLHKYVNQGVADGYQTRKCSRCGKEEKIAIITDFQLYWNLTGLNDTFNYTQPEHIEVGQTLYYRVLDYTDTDTSYEDRNKEMILEASDDSVETEDINGIYGRITCNKAGKYNITIYPKHNPECKVTISVIVGDYKGDDTSGGKGDNSKGDNPSGDKGDNSKGDNPSGDNSKGDDPSGEILFGDITQDGKVDLSDALYALNAALGITDITPTQEKIADVDGTGGLTLNDVQLILKRALQIISVFPVEE